MFKVTEKLYLFHLITAAMNPHGEIQEIGETMS